ncbi:MAG: serine hydrolase [Puniceicoccaceae bacterium]|nr:MAG: serine hydrolase [Puniceicoccaceae bacterium]
MWTRIASLFLLAPCLSAMPGFVRDPGLQRIVDRVVEETVATLDNPPFGPEQIALTLVRLGEDAPWRFGSHRGMEQVFPASVVKLCYLQAAHHWMEEGKMEATDEVDRALRDMIVRSGNEPTHYIVDLLTGTTSGPELPPEELEEWLHRRNAINRYFAGLGYTRLNANRKPWWEGPYGREMQSFRVHQPIHRNWMTSDETARILVEIATGAAVTPERSEAMMALLRRDLATPEGRADSQVSGYIGEALPHDALLWSKAGYTSRARHDAAVFELADGRRFVLTVFTKHRARDEGLLPGIARRVLDAL